MLGVEIWHLILFFGLSSFSSDKRNENFPSCLPDHISTTEGRIKCLSEQFQDVLKNGDHSLSVAPLTGIQLPKLRSSFENKANRYDITYKNVSLYGTENYILNKIKHYHALHVLTLRFYWDRLYLTSIADIRDVENDRKFVGNGTLTANLKDISLVYNVHYATSGKNGVNYVKVTSNKVDIYVEDVNGKIEPGYTSGDLLREFIRGHFQTAVYEIKEELQNILEKMIATKANMFLKVLSIE